LRSLHSRANTNDPDNRKVETIGQPRQCLRRSTFRIESNGDGES